ncbi:uncharacterized protein LOC118409532 isoform X5 [Branchiostoma floridae]|uniref:Uncharacterized protein LOC118409532 isoform X5 n=1 Tax=Branchiostoma floridae TaxID=7739 RepID=A0A9J7KM60_BRAFL|nr:uncharacterized protein LOC118409532 isoform X5 [Branchiostoma floridae]
MEQNGWGPPAVDLNFLKSGLGVLKLVQMILSLTGFIVAEVTASPYNWEQMKAFEWISLTIFILTLAVFTTFLASWHKSEAVVRVNWPLVDFCHSALCTVLWSINLILALVVTSDYGPGELVGAIIDTVRSWETPTKQCWYSPQQDNTEMSGKNLERSTVFHVNGQGGTC